MNVHLTHDQVVEIFEKAWSELCDEYPEKRERLNFYSEADLQVHLARKLLDRLPSGWVHIEVPLRLGKIEEFSGHLWVYGRPVRWREGEPYEADIAIVDPEDMYPCLLAELKYNPIYWSVDLLRHLVLSKRIKRETVQIVKSELKRLLQDLKLSEIGRGDLAGNLSNVAKLSAALRELRGLGKTVQGYLCVIDEVYSNAPLEEELRKAIREHDPQIKLLVQSYCIEEIVEEVLRHLETIAAS
jgi:hypothetical protein